ncbi:MAG: hypothetical protein EOP83_06030 [Verrucomicrobiaceae bacterium]|nr:MAG: hypothetical protein EOP83_06030 [Verrucomicrobiaceae bacterium]
MAQEAALSRLWFEYGIHDPRYQTHRVEIRRKMTNGLHMEIFAWLRSDESQGHYHTRHGDMSEGHIFLFTDPDTAFAFRMRFG